jgi:3-deoxy-D-manno-octulosonic-acid transferase
VTSPAATPRERISRIVYSIVWIVATPAIAAYLLWRSRKQPAYRRGWAQRFFGSYGARRASPCLWVHAVSVGETRAAAPLIAALQARHPDLTILVTHMTPTGRETAEAIFGDRVVHAYLAYDYPHAVAAFFRHWRPELGIVMETEIWPNLMAAARRAGTPMLLANGRLSPRSLVSARRWPALMRPAARGFARILAQTDADAKRFAMLTETEQETTSSITIVGNMKFDIEVPEAQRALSERFRDRLRSASDTKPPRIFLFASTRDGEEEQILDAWLRHESRGAPVHDDGPVVLVIVPRHPQRFDAVFDLAKSRGLRVQRRSDDNPLDAGTQVWLGDSMGELWAYYLAADLAYIGGSIVPLGGQNLIEAAAAGCPILIGRHTFNFAAASEAAVRAGAALRVNDFDALILKGLEVAHDAERRRRMGAAGMVFAESHRGATARSVAIAEEIIDAWGSMPSNSRS